MTAVRTSCAAGLSTAIVEKNDEGLGGDCTWWGCVPSKSLIEIARLVHRAKSLDELGIDTARPDFTGVMERVARTVSAIAHSDRPQVFQEVGIDVIPGEAVFLDDRKIEVGGDVYEADKFVITTGAGPSIPQIDGIGSVPYLTNREVFDLEKLPARLLVLGGGSIGVELSQAFQRLGSRVTIVELEDRLLPLEDEESASNLLEVLRGEGVEARLNAKAIRVERAGDDIVLTVDESGESQQLVGDALLVATGRKAETEGLGLERAEVETENGFIKVDRRARTSNKRIYAAGDVTGEPFLSHVAAHEGVVAGSQAAGKWWMRANYRVVPRVTFTDPEVASVGLTEAAARDRYGSSIDVATFPMSHVDRARILGEESGVVKLITKRRSPLGRLTGGRLVGAHIVGAGAGELIHEPALVMQTRSFTARLAQTIHAYPTLSVAVQQAASQYFPAGRAVVPKD